MKKHYLSHFVLCFTVFCLQMSAQSRFTGGIFGGINLAQIDGDKQQGYDKLMLTAGVRGGVILGKIFDIGTELIYNGKGARPRNDGSLNRTPALTAELHYAEVMLTFNTHFGMSDEGFYRKTFTIGASYGRLLTSTVDVQNNHLPDSAKIRDLRQENFKSSDIGLMLGFSYRFTPKIGVALRHTLSLSRFYENPLYYNKNVKVPFEAYYSFSSYFLSLHVFYDFLTPKLIKKRKGKKKY